MNIHDRIRLRRIACNLSIEDLAAAVARIEGLPKPLSRQTIEQWENGSTAPKRTRMPAVAEALNTTVEALLTGQSSSPEGSEPPLPDTVPLELAVRSFTHALSQLSPSAWAMVRAALEGVVGHPEMYDDATNNVLLVLNAPIGKRRRAA